MRRQEMQTDFLLEKVFDDKKWEAAILDGQQKDINKQLLEQLCIKSEREKLKNKIANGEYTIAPPHEARIPKDNGDFRTVYVNTGLDRVLLAIINDTIFELCKDAMVHPSCKSYLKGLGCGKTVQQVSRYIQRIKRNDIGIKTDLTKYFDSVPIQYIDDIFDKIKDITGESKILELLQTYYHMDTVLDLQKQPITKYSSLRQGCAFAAFLADAILYHIDSKISKMNVVYVRYSDDILILGDNWEYAYEKLQEMLQEMSLVSNPKKVEFLHKDTWFKFLGFELKNDLITLSAQRIKTFQKDIEKCTIKTDENDIDTIVHNVHTVLYTGPDGYSWATSVLPIINSQKDISNLNGFVMDAIRATKTNKKKIGGLGINKTEKNGIIIRSKGRHVKHNKETIPFISNYMTIKCMQNAILASKQAFELLTSTI